MFALHVFLFYPIYTFNPIQGKSVTPKATLFYPFPWAPPYILKLCLKTHILPAQKRKTAYFYNLSIIHRALALVSYFSERKGWTAGWFMEQLAICSGEYAFNICIFSSQK